MNHLSSYQKQYEDHQKSGKRGNDGSAQDLVYAVVDGSGKIAFLSEKPKILPDPIKQHHGIIQGVSRQGKKGGYYEQGNLLMQDEKYP